MKKVVIVGAGPAGLTAAYELLSKSKEYEVVIFEESDKFGGISRTVVHHGNRMDMGGHRFFSKVPEVNEWWEKMLGTQGRYFTPILAFLCVFAASAGQKNDNKNKEEIVKATVDEENKISPLYFFVIVLCNLMAIVDIAVHYV